MSLLRELYQEVILDHNRNPRNFRAIADATKHVEGYNPLCGDHYTIYLKMDGEIISDVSFEGTGCAISKSSASVMTSIVKGKTRAEAEKVFKDFHNLVQGKLDAAEHLEALGKLVAFAGVSEFPARVKCASLAWHSLNTALQEASETTVTTE